MNSNQTIPIEELIERSKNRLIYTACSLISALCFVLIAMNIREVRIFKFLVLRNVGLVFSRTKSTLDFIASNALNSFSSFKKKNKY